MALGAGRLRQRIEIQDYIGGLQDSHGDDIRDYFPFARNVPAEIVDKGGRALFVAQQSFAEANALITIRYLSGITDRMRVYYAEEDRYYDILNVGRGAESRRSEIQLICRSGVVVEVDQPGLTDRADAGFITTRLYLPDVP